MFVCVVLCMVVCVASVSAAPACPFPMNLTYATGSIRPNHVTQDQMNNDVRMFYEQWKVDYLVNEGGDPVRYRISYGSSNPSRTVSEGQGYGMVITAIMAGYDPDAKEIFDGLLAFVDDHPSNIDSRLMAWQVPEGSGGEDCAFDGDADIAYGLLLAHAQWGSDGDIDYLSRALERITAIKESLIGPDSRYTLLGDWVDPYGSHYNQYTPRTSDFMPAHFRSYAVFSGDEIWDEVISAIQSAVESIQTTYSPDTGLLPDFIEPVSDTDLSPRPADPWFLEGEHDGDYNYNAGRDPWRIGTDALLNGDAVSWEQCGRMADWIAESTGEDPSMIRAGYELDGTPLSGSNYFTTFFAAPFGVAMMTQPDRQAFLNDIYDAVRIRHEDYYEDSVNLLCLLVMSGNYWDPAAVPVQVPAAGLPGHVAIILILSVMMVFRFWKQR